MRDFFQKWRRFVPFLLWALAFIFLIRLLTREPPLKIEGMKDTSVSLSESQRREVGEPPADGVLVIRYKNSKGHWEVAIGKEDLPSDAVAKTAIGIVSKEPNPPQFDQPLYLCSYRGFTPPTFSLDNSKTCSRGGDLVHKRPVGFGSSVIRTGFYLISRCISASSGMYLTSNVKCDQPGDRWDGNIGALRAARVK